MVGELKMRVREIQEEPIETIYFGGGTPSLLSVDELNIFFDVLEDITSLSSLKEITLEANPDDLSKNYLNSLTSTPINRLSIGVQSFFQEDLTWMNRAHNASQAINCIIEAQEIGFENITIDLIYGSPTTTHQMWEENLNIWYDLNLPHLSAYCLTVEEKTALHHQINVGLSKPVDEEHSLAQFSFLQSFCTSHQIEQYEISNFARNQHYSLHNSNYWTSKPYIGIGPSAHSFNGGKNRRWNIRNNANYMKLIKENSKFWEEEYLDDVDLMNEYIMIRLRTTAGIQKEEFNTKFGAMSLQKMEASMQKELMKNRIVDIDNCYRIPKEYLFQADDIIAGLFFEND